MYRFLTIMLLVAASLGCSDQQIGDVRGTVTLDGSPLEGAMVLFEPREEGRPSLAVTDSQGKYELTFSAERHGAAIGDHLVRITTARDAAFDDSGKVTTPGVKERIPIQYNSNSTQVVSVKPGDNQIDFSIATLKE